MKQDPIVLQCPDLDPVLEYLTETLGFRVESVFPADNPRVVELSKSGSRIRLVKGPVDEAPQPGRVPTIRASFELTRAGGASAWQTGRAGMLYRDLVPGRQGGYLVGSHIRIPQGGPVPDYVHYHRVRFQMIYCRRGWVRVVYEDQGEPFNLQAGDAVLQATEIRHRVLECSDGLEVVELGVPAEHLTLADHEMVLPTKHQRPERRFQNQHFVRHQAEAAPWQKDSAGTWEVQDLGISAATREMVDARVVRSLGSRGSATREGLGELEFVFILTGDAKLCVDGRMENKLASDDALVIPGGMLWQLDFAEPLEYLSVVFRRSHST